MPTFPPDSQHLPLVAEAVDQLGRVAAPPTSVAQRPMSEQWARALKRESEFPSPVSADPWVAANVVLLATWAARAPSYMDGSCLIHSDLDPGNILVSDRAQVVDWAWWQTGAAWFDPAYLVIRLIAEGHDPEAAEKWALQFDGFAAAPPEALTAFTASVVRMWERGFSGTAATNAALRWARYRLV